MRRPPGRRLRRARAAIALVAALAASGLPVRAAEPQPNVADARLAAIVSQYFATEWELDPVRATLAGVHTGDDRLGDYGEAGYERRIAFVHRTLREVITLDFGDLSPERDDDAETLRAHLELELMTLEERRTYRHDPTIALKLAATAAQSLLERDYAPLATRLRALLARERAIPAMLADAARAIDDVDPGIVEISRESIGGTVAYFRGPVASAAAGADDPALAAGLAQANAAVVAALVAFGATLETGAFLRPGTSFALGADRFTRMLQLGELEPALTTAEFERTAIGSLERSRSQFATTAQRIDAARAPQAVLADLAGDHPPEARLLATASDDVASLGRFVDEHHLLTLPPATEVRVVATPDFLRAGGTFASVSVPGPLEREPGVSYYDVTLPSARESAGRRASDLALFNPYAFPLVSAHEVMPGHAVNLELDRRERLSDVRRLLPSHTFTEGWAHYVEQMLVEEGWGGGDPRVRLAELELELQRECRAIVAIRLHSQGMSLADATHFFVENAYLSDDAARREALRALHDPTDGDYLLGKLEILKLRDDVKAKAGSHFTLLAFHDALLAHGNAPAAIVRKLLLGPDDDGRLLY